MHDAAYRPAPVTVAIEISVAPRADGVVTQPFAPTVEKLVYGDCAEREPKPHSTPEVPQRKYEKPQPKRLGVDPLVVPSTRQVNFPALPLGASTSQKVAILNNDTRALVLDEIAPALVTLVADRPSEFRPSCAGLLTTTQVVGQ